MWHNNRTDYLNFFILVFLTSHVIVAGEGVHLIKGKIRHPSLCQLGHIDTVTLHQICVTAPPHVSGRIDCISRKERAPKALADRRGSGLCGADLPSISVVRVRNKQAG